MFPSLNSADTTRREELGAFLRSRRERITPDQVGLVRTGRRRTPGLRREEVAAMAGVGVTWYTWLEQGRDIHVSDEVLGAISRTLQSDPHERRHLLALAGSGEQVPVTECAAITPAITTILERLAPLPACVLNGRAGVEGTRPAPVGGIRGVPGAMGAAGRPQRGEPREVPPERLGRLAAVRLHQPVVRAGTRLVTYTPADVQTEERLQQLAALSG